VWRERQGVVCLSVCGEREKREREREKERERKRERVREIERVESVSAPTRHVFLARIAIFSSSTTTMKREGGRARARERELERQRYRDTEKQRQRDRETLAGAVHSTSQRCDTPSETDRQHAAAAEESVLWHCVSRAGGSVG
jgi:proteasome lid subunit RPN8/RPN11